MTASDGSIEIATVGAIRLALAAASDDTAALTMIQWLIEKAPATEPGDDSSVRLLLEGIQSLGLSVSTASPSGAYA